MSSREKKQKGHGSASLPPHYHQKFQVVFYFTKRSFTSPHVYPFLNRDSNILILPFVCYTICMKFFKTFKRSVAVPIVGSELDQQTADRLDRINRELRAGFDFIRPYQKSVSFFGSARFDENNKHYKYACEIAKNIVTELGYAVVTGGGHGIMEAANKGASEAGGVSLGVTIKLPHEQHLNQYVQKSINCNYFFTRKVILAFSAEAYIFFPGGFGTLDEFFGILTLIQTHKIPKVPLILVGKDYWEPLQETIFKDLYEEHGTISKNDMRAYTITDDPKEILEIVRKAPMRKE
ncbi:TIGR00730 family Rossman fold protein [Patescibacteria group bacterium]|nr:MAG: TIGR00730 family Rossman fold protein [Patescibacteria group bacterium]